MIIKSMSRKAPTFRQLSGYIGQGSSSGASSSFSRNLYYDGDNQDIVTRLFEENYKFLPPRKNGNALYHEVIVLPPQPHLTRTRQMQILQSLAHKYCELRAPHQLAWGQAHFDTAFPHIHLMISANGVHSDRRKRHDRQSFGRIQQQVERFKEVTFPELVDERVYNKAHKSNVRLTKGENEFIRRTKTPSSKQSIALQLKSIFKTHTHLVGLKAELRRSGFTLYQRGSQWGVEADQTGRRYRLKTLGLAERFEAITIQSQARGHTEETKPQLGSDARAEALLKHRAQLERHAADQLIDFERSGDDEFER